MLVEVLQRRRRSPLVLGSWKNQLGKARHKYSLVSLRTPGLIPKSPKNTEFIRLNLHLGQVVKASAAWNKSEGCVPFRVTRAILRPWFEICAIHLPRKQNNMLYRIYDENRPALIAWRSSVCFGVPQELPLEMELGQNLSFLRGCLQWQHLWLQVLLPTQYAILHKTGDIKSKHTKVEDTKPLMTWPCLLYWSLWPTAIMYS